MSRTGRPRTRPGSAAAFTLLELLAIVAIAHVIIARDIANLLSAPNRDEARRLLDLAAERYRSKAPRLSSWMQENIPEGFTVFRLPYAMRRRLRTTNMIERLNREIKRRTRVASLFPNEASLLRLVSAILMETSEEWETKRIAKNLIL